jgi:hypothetical protein
MSGVRYVREILEDLCVAERATLKWILQEWIERVEVDSSGSGYGLEGRRLHRRPRRRWGEILK